MASRSFYRLCVNDLLTELDSSGLGACVSDVFVSSPMYVDDLVLVAATASDLQGMLNIFHSYSRKWKYKLNASKSKILVLGCREPPPSSSHHVSSDIICFTLE